MAKRKQASGWAKNHKQGKKTSQLWYTPEQYDMVKRAAKAVNRSMTNFALYNTLIEARKVLKAAADESGKSLEEYLADRAMEAAPK